jgi:hypothetical protein
MALFRYFPPERGLRVLAMRELGVTPPKYLNDPFECSPVIKCKDPEAYARRRIDEITTSSDYFENHRDDFPGLTFEQFQSVLRENASQLVKQMAGGRLKWILIFKLRCQTL